MALFNLTDSVYLPNWNVWARPVTVTPLKSQPGAPAYGGRGYFDTKETDVMTEDGGILSDARSYLDILFIEFPIPPMQGDLIDIPFHQGVEGGSFEVLDLAGVGNAGGMINITLKRIVTPKPTPTTYELAP
jgi:hypothetical protein